MSDSLPKAYDPKTIDSKWYKFWQDREFFSCNPYSFKEPYCIVMPPPNVTGVLHMGHALVNTLQDILIRWKRMCGYDALWIPGTDHAGISTQTIVERNLIAKEGKRRKDYTREDFLNHVWKWKEDNEALILNQLKRLGSSCDWKRQRFTMDEGNNKAVRVMFKKLFDKGLIYRGDYLVNWDPLTQTALADDEVEYEEQNTFLWYIKYPLADGSGSISIATTRPETMLGDTAVAVSPNDERYSHLVGKQIILPLVNKQIPIIADHRIDASFGTGAVKITPAHDPNDYQMGLTHNLPMLNILTPDGKINENGASFAGLSIENARSSVVKALQEKGFIEKIVPYTNRVGVSYRSKAIIQPYLSKQWFIKMSYFKDKLRSCVSSGSVKLIPKHWENTYFHWIDNLRDWCISRQLWWGHRIPIWYNKSDDTKMICYDGIGTPDEVINAPNDWQQDDDVLDTWFSSALWPFSTLDWPDDSADLKKYYPNSVLVTGHDILFFWVARMLLMGEFALGEYPFPETFLHGLIYGKSYWRNQEGGGIRYVLEEERTSYETGKQVPSDVHFKWEKMSKSKGNVIDPIEMIDTYGTDAVRMALTASATQARQIDLDRRRFEEFKNFANKIWNGSRFVFMNLEGKKPLDSNDFAKGLDPALFSLEDKWILSALNQVIKDVNTHLSNYAFDKSATVAYDFFWKQFCAYYVEIAKPTLFGKQGNEKELENKQKILVIVLLAALRLLHPMAPFITEELFQKIKERMGSMHSSSPCIYANEALLALQAPACIVAPYPQVIDEEDISPVINTLFSNIEEIVYAIRNIRGEMKLAPNLATKIYIVGKESLTSSFKENGSIISSLIPTTELIFSETEPVLDLAGSAFVKDFKILIPLPQELQEQEKLRLNKEQEKLQLTLQKIKEQLSNQDFLAKAPAPYIEKLKQQEQQAEEALLEIQRNLSSRIDF
ncbi:MAG: valine--tRNA ligase [Chlamydiales bacterium]|nr:valine--tRNA ligase [Chlamydiales bacterium]